MSVIAGAAAFRAEAEPVVEGDGGGVAGADFEGEMAGVILGGPVSDGVQESGGETLAAGFGLDCHGVQLAGIFVAG
jgi:hypothetical protein